MNQTLANLANFHGTARLSNAPCLDPRGSIKRRGGQAMALLFSFTGEGERDKRQRAKLPIRLHETGPLPTARDILV